MPSGKLATVDASSYSSSSYMDWRTIYTTTELQTVNINVVTTSSVPIQLYLYICPSATTYPLGESNPAVSTLMPYMIDCFKIGGSIGNVLERTGFALSAGEKIVLGIPPSTVANTAVRVHGFSEV